MKRKSPVSDKPDWSAVFESCMRVTLGSDGSHDIGHLCRVWKNAQTIAVEEGGDQEILVAAAWLHDLVSPPKDSAERSQASALSAEAAGAILQHHRFPSAKIQAVKHAILAHSFSADIAPQTLEAEIIQDADRLDALGAVGIARVFYTAGQMNSALFHLTDPEALHRALDEKTYALDHFQTKLFRLPEKLRTEAARQMARERVAVMSTFVNDLLGEISEQ